MRADGLLFIFHGHLNNYNRNTDSIYSVDILSEQPKVTCYPGFSTYQHLNNDDKKEIQNFRYLQRGCLPPALSGHAVYFINRTEAMIIGGQSYRKGDNEIFCRYRSPSQPLSIFNTFTSEWRQVQLSDEHCQFLHRSNFGSVQVGSKIFVTG